jgi:hypothetical protein
MRLPSVLLEKALFSGSAASIVSTAVLVARGRRELDAPAAPVNAPSQWVWGLHAPYVDRPSLRHTAVGYAIHHLASVFWACFYEYAIARRRARDPLTVVKIAAGSTAAAAFVDYCLTPERLEPGFQKRLSTRSLVMVYGGFAAGLALATLAGSLRKS